MEENLQFESIRKEFSEEIDSKIVSLEDLKNLKVPTDVLKAEVALREVFGDEIYKNKKEDDNVAGEKEIVKLTSDDLAFDSEVREICDNIADNEFDSAVGVILSKIDEMEE